jgi:hypothetical protein
METTIIDILKKGNLELFHSSMISWLMDPTRNQGIGVVFLKEFFKKAFQDRAKPSLPMIFEKIDQGKVSVQTEVTGKGGRYDIFIEVDDFSFVIENKTKSIGKDTQLEKYLDEVNHKYVIALGLVEESFKENVRSKFPFVTYNDILEIIHNIPFNLIRNTDYLVLLRHYERFLQRELSILHSIKETFEHNNTCSLPSKKDIQENDRRFYNLFYLQRFKEFRIKAKPDWISQEKNGSWHELDKNMRSGVWYAFDCSNFKWHSDIQNFRIKQSLHKNATENPLHLWFHVELYAHNGILETDSAIACGEIQLRSNQCKDGNDKIFMLLKDFLKDKNIGDRFEFSSKITKKSNTFYVLKRKLYKNDLNFYTLFNILEEFTELFGVLEEKTQKM